MRSLEDMAARLAEALPPQTGALSQEVRSNLRAILQSQLAHLDLVPREEFEAAREMLAHSRKRLVELEKKVAELERNSGNTSA